MQQGRDLYRGQKTVDRHACRTGCKPSTRIVGHQKSHTRCQVAAVNLAFARNLVRMSKARVLNLVVSAAVLSCKARSRSSKSFFLLLPQLCPVKVKSVVDPSLAALQIAMAEARAPAGAAAAAEDRPPLRRLPAFDDGPMVPKVGQRIMVLRQPWLDYILDGSKTMELRSRRYRMGHAWLGMGGRIYGRVNVVGAVALTTEELQAREQEHRWPADADVPYKTTWGLMLADVERLPEPLSYWRPQHAIGWNVYREQPEDLPMKSHHIKKDQQPKKRAKVSEEAALDDDAEGALPLAVKAEGTS